jgi:hypothetical protein
MESANLLFREINETLSDKLLQMERNYQESLAEK